MEEAVWGAGLWELGVEGSELGECGAVAGLVEEELVCELGELGVVGKWDAVCCLCG